MKPDDLDEIAELLAELVRMKRARVVIPFLVDGRIEWTPEEQVPLEARGDGLTEDQVIEHYVRGGE